MTTHRVGGEVDSFCTRCRLLLAHTILAMVGPRIARVRCNTCGGDHTYRQEPGAHPPPASPRPARPERVLLSFEQVLAGKDLARARRYSPKDTYAVEEVIEHPSFGLGLVNAVRGDKVDVAFRAFEKTLVHARGEGSSKPAYQPPRGGASAPADKPLPEEPGPAKEPSPG